MSEITLARLRILRSKAVDLMRCCITDLAPFLHEDNETFRRKPESDSIANDVNVTTTCSCLMSLALTGSFKEFYGTKDEAASKIKAETIFKRLVDAPWMSSGLVANNAFSTTLVIRTYGFLRSVELIPDASQWQKDWVLHLGITDACGLAAHLEARKDDASKLLYSCLSDRSRNLLKKAIPEQSQKDEFEEHERKLRSAFALDFSHLVQSANFYSESRFPKATDNTKQLLASWPTGYELAVANQLLLVDQFPKYFVAPTAKALQTIAAQLAKHPEQFAINDYTASTTVVYWFVDALERGDIPLEGAAWKSLCHWATNQFNRERSLVLAEHDAMMDPVAMAMAACLCAKLRSIATKGELGTDKAHREILPSLVELEHSVKELFKRQTSSGIWPKYFPLFHYQDAGSNFCFTFELLEAILTEFGGDDNSVLDDPAFFEGLERAVVWCEQNRLECSEKQKGTEKQKAYAGWNSGGDIESLKRERPESWATAVVHMFLSELHDVISERIQKRVLRKYNARPPKVSVVEMLKVKSAREKYFGKSLDKLQDIDILLGEDHVGLVSILKNSLLNNNFGKSESEVRRAKTASPVSALLFGPPGTSKTQVTKAIADDLGWPMIEINPSEFVKGSFANVYLQAEEIFADLMDLAGVVVLFDEMDALTQKRGLGGGGVSQLDTATQFLTTSMLPKLAALHDQGGVVFFMATNFQENFDPAIKRAGRFDMLLCMGPPMVKEKINKMDLFFKPKTVENEQKNKSIAALREYIEGSEYHELIFSLLTFGDCKSLLSPIGDATNIGDKLQSLGKIEFRNKLNSYSNTIALKYDEFVALGKGVMPLDVFDKKVPTADLRTAVQDRGSTDLGRYLLERRESKLQY